MAKIVFMGTPDFAVPTLQALINSKHDVTAVYTKEPKEKGRGLKIVRSPVHDIADSHKIKVFYPKNLRSESEIINLKNLSPDIIVVVAYGLILSKDILDIPKNGCLNLHPSSLPRWRGAAPIERAIMANDTTTEICIMSMDEGMDTGPVIKRKKIFIDEEINSGDLKKEIGSIGAEMMLATIKEIIAGKAKYNPQNNTHVTYANKITKEEERINWHNDGKTIHCQIRALSPKPSAYFKHNDKIIKISEAKYLLNHQDQSLQPGQVIKHNDTIAVVCGDRSLIVPLLLQKEGGKNLSASDFLNGYRIKEGDIVN